MTQSKDIDTLDQLCSKIVESGDETDLVGAFLAQLAMIAEAKALQDLAEKYTPHSEVSIPILSRVVELSPQNVSALVGLGFVYWLDGEDDEARSRMEQAKKLCPDDTGVMTLEAAFSSDKQAKLELYQKILEKEPDNEVAKANLRELKICQ